jgi:ABC-type lipoprotein release transport system permease subunit
MQRVTSLLYRPGATDAAYVIGAVVVLLLRAVSATLVPAGRAARVSPIEAIRID